jgi:hypothetical protein
MQVTWYRIQLPYAHRAYFKFSTSCKLFGDEIHPHAHNLDPSCQQSADLIQSHRSRAKPGKDINVLEQKKINEYGGLKKNGGTLENKRNQISEKKWTQNGIEPPK